MAKGNIRIVLIEPGPTTTDATAQASRPTAKRHEVWADRRDARGDRFTESRAVSGDAETIFRIRDFGPDGLRPTKNWRIIDLFDGNREYRVVHVQRVKDRMAFRSTHYDLHGSYKGVHIAA